MSEAKFYKDMDIDVYHGHKDIISKSMLGDFADCPARFKYKYIDGGEPKKSKSLRLGNAVHVLALEPELWKSSYHTLPETYYNTKGEKKKFQNRSSMQVVQDQYELAGYEVKREEGKDVEFVATEKSKVILTTEEFKNVELMANSLAKNNFACKLLKAPGYVESSIFWEDEFENTMTGEVEKINMRCRPDFMRNDGLIADLKIARTVNPEMFHKDAYNYHYDLSVALTFRGYEKLYNKPAENYVFICVEQTAPYIVECFESLLPMDPMTGLSYLEYGQAHLDHLIGRYLDCKGRNFWPGYQEKIGGMAIPGWAIKNYIERGF